MPRKHAPMAIWQAVLQSAAKPGPRYLHCADCGDQITAELPVLKPSDRPRTIAANCGTCGVSVGLTLLPPPVAVDWEPRERASASAITRPESLEDRIAITSKPWSHCRASRPGTCSPLWGLDPRSRAHGDLVRRIVTSSSFITHGCLRWQLKSLRRLGAPRDAGRLATYVGAPLPSGKPAKPSTTNPTNTNKGQGGPEQWLI